MPLSLAHKELLGVDVSIHVESQSEFAMNPGRVEFGMIPSPLQLSS